METNNKKTDTNHGLDVLFCQINVMPLENKYYGDTWIEVLLYFIPYTAGSKMCFTKNEWGAWNYDQKCMEKGENQNLKTPPFPEKNWFM